MAKPRRLSFELGPLNPPRLTLDELDALVNALEGRWPGAALHINGSVEPNPTGKRAIDSLTKYGLDIIRREVLSFNVPASVKEAEACAILERELARVGRSDLIPQIN